MTGVIGSAILRTQTDERLVALSRDGHQPAFEAIAERYRAELTRSLRRLLPTGSVEDALQQTHLQAWKALSGGTEVRELRAWLHRIARNAAIAVGSRGYDYDELQDALLVTPGPEHELERREAVRRALRGIAELPERQRAALLAVAVGGRSHAEVALELGITDTAARQLVRRARVSLLALASIVTPPQLVLWAARAGHSMVAGKAAAGTGTGIGGSLAGPALKLGVVAVTMGGVAAGVGPIGHALVQPTPAPHHQRRARHTSAAIYAATVLPLRATPGRPSSTGAGQTTTGSPSTTATPLAARRHRTHRVRPVSTDAIGKTALPNATTAPAAPATPPSAAPTSAATSTPAAATTAAKVSPLAALVAWWYAHRQAGTSTATASAAAPAASGAPQYQTSSTQPTPTGACAAGGSSPTGFGQGPRSDASGAGSETCSASRSRDLGSAPGASASSAGTSSAGDH